jgi:hypothetical protein
MTRKQQLENALRMITQRAGIPEAGQFHVTQVSQDADGLFLMEVSLPEGLRLYEAVGRNVSGFPVDACATCVPLLPQLVDEIIMSAQPDLCAQRDRRHD